MSTLGGDVRYALRSLKSNPGFAAIAIGSLALGIGVNTAVFSGVDQLLLRRLPVRTPEQLVYMKGSRIQTYPFYREFRDRNQVFSGLFAARFPDKLGVRPEDAAQVEVGNLNWVSGNYFQVLGVGAARGRVLTQDDDLKPGGSPVVVLSYRYWERRFNADPNVIGRKYVIDGFPLEIIGVVQKGFTGLIPNSDDEDVYSPITMMPAVERARAEVWDSPNMHWLSVMGRLKPGVSLEQAQASLRVLQPQVEELLASRVAEARPNRNKPRWEPNPIVLEPGDKGLPMAREQFSRPLIILLLATGFVLLIACVNVANLLLARAAGRSREVAVRMAIGASRARLVRQLLTESLILSLAGTMAGFAFAWWGVEGLAKLTTWAEPLRLRPDWHLLLFAIGIAITTGLLFGTVPGLRTIRTDLSSSMKEGGNSSQARGRFRLGKALVSAQVALSLALLVGAGLFTQTLRRLRNADTGFRRENVLVVDVDPSNLGYTEHRLRTFYDRFLERVRQSPGVRAAALSGMTPLGTYARSRTFSAEGYQIKEGERLLAFSNPVSSDYFATLGIPMMLGRDFRAEDEPAVTPAANFLSKVGRNSGGSGEPPRSAIKSVIVNESLARKLFGTQNPVGKRINYDDQYSAEGSLEIVGVVHDVRYSRLKQADEIGMIYEPSWGEGADARWLIMRTAGDPKAIVSAVRAELRALDPNIPIIQTRTMEEYVDGAMQMERIMASLCALFSALALLLAAVGLYGVMAYSVTRRTKEVGIRMALGAQRRDVVTMIIRESLVPVCCGVVAGLAASLVLTRFIAGMLYGVKPVDPVSIGVAAIALVAVALFASALPARRASRVEPTIALRYE